MDKSIKKPNFFIIGAPKCGTTALSEYLRSHPDIFFSNPKELHYFNTDFSLKQRRFHKESDYLEVFREAETFKAVGEGSVLYLYSKNAVPNILKFNPKAKFIIMVRNPLELAISSHAQSIKSGRENIKDFKAAWNMQEIRKMGEKIPKTCTDPQLLQYGERCKLGEQIEKVLSLVPKERVLIIFYDDFKANTVIVYRNVLKFLDLPNDGRSDFPVINKRRTSRSRFLSLAMKSACAIKKIFRIKKSFPALNTVIQRLNTKYPNSLSQLKQLNQNFKKDLLSYFEKDIEKLQSITGRDLTSWKILPENNQSSPKIRLLSCGRHLNIGIFFMPKQILVFLLKMYRATRKDGIINFYKKLGFFKKENELLAYWFEKKDITNFGDMLNPYLIEKLAHKKPRLVNEFCTKNYLIMVGSIMSKVNRHATVWGAGIKYRNERFNKPGKILAVRGPLTGSRMSELGYKTTRTYGDPAMLMPLIYKAQGAKKYKLGIIPHYVDYKKVSQMITNKNLHIINVLDPVEKTIDNINSCSFTITSSLHGLIISHAYGIPSIWVEFSSKLSGDGTKFNDYLLSVNLPAYNPPNLNKNELSEDFLKSLISSKASMSLPKSAVVKEMQRDILAVAPFPKNISKYF